MVRRLILLLAFFFFVFPVFAARTDIDAPITKKVMVLIFNTVLENQGGVKLYDYMRWSNPDTLIQEYIQEIASLSGGYLNYQVVARHEIDDYPIKGDGFQYTDETYLACMSNSALCHKPDLDNYNILLTKYMDICTKHNNNEFDEILMVGAPWFGFYEAVMTGPGAFWTNGGPITGTSCQRKLNIMGFVPDRTVSEMLEDMGHRFEGTMKFVYGSWEKTATHVWNRFTLIDKYNPGQAACGYVHYAPNSQSDYNWVNTTPVASTCEDWLNYPDLTGFQETLNCSRWGCTSLGYKKWWLHHIPKYKGIGPDGKLLNWWHYVADFDDAKAMEQVIRATVTGKIYATGNSASGVSGVRVGIQDGANPPVWQDCTTTDDHGNYLLNWTSSNPLFAIRAGSSAIGCTTGSTPTATATGSETMCTGAGYLVLHEMCPYTGALNTTIGGFDFMVPILPTLTNTPVPLQGDINNDGTINYNDLLILLANFKLTGTRPSDVVPNQLVDIFDYALLTAHFGEK